MERAKEIQPGKGEWRFVRYKSGLREVPHHLVHDSFVPLAKEYATAEYPASEYTGVDDTKLLAQY